jgi:hypothetical protein
VYYRGASKGYAFVVEAKMAVIGTDHALPFVKTFFAVPGPEDVFLIFKS